MSRCKSAQIMGKVEKCLRTKMRSAPPTPLFLELSEKREITDPTSYLHV
jgi:hypothetical protein